MDTEPGQDDARPNVRQRTPRERLRARLSASTGAIKGFRPKAPAEREDAYSPDARSQMWGSFRREARAAGRSWQGCAVCPPERRDPNAELDVHHVIPQQKLKAVARDRKVTKLTLLRWLTDPRNAILVCPTCHLGDTTRMEPIPRIAIPEPAWEYADELGLAGLVLERYR